MRHAALGLLFLLLAGCAQSIEDGGTAEGSFLKLEGFTLVQPEQGRLRGFLRWMYVDADPSRSGEPGIDCEIWEELDLLAGPVEADCAGCDYQFEGTSRLEAGGQSTCEDPGWTERNLTLGFGTIAEAESDLAALADDGYTHLVQSRWAPETGDGTAFSPLFAARPAVWAPDEGGGIEGSGSDAVLSGQHELFCPWFWEF